jgi:hypothetical protein
MLLLFLCTTTHSTLTSQTATVCYCVLLLRFTSQVNKALYESGRVLALKDVGKGFPVARPVGVLRWSLTTNDESAMPLTINCWPEEEGNGVMNVNIEYTLQVLYSVLKIL